MSNIIKEIEAEQLKETVDQFEVGDTVKVYGKIKEGNRERIQVFEGTIISKKGGGISETREVWGRELEQRYRQRVGGCMKDTRIVYASKGNDAALLGAAKFGFELLEHQQEEERK